MTLSERRERSAAEAKRRAAPADPAQPPEGEADDAPEAPQAAGAPGAWGDNLPWSPKNLLVPYLLLALSAYEAHGYWLQQQLRTYGFLSTNITTIYRTLRQLEKQGLVSSYWQPTDEGPARRIYSLTDTGRSTLGMWAGALQSYRSMIDSFFGMYGIGPAARTQPPEPPKNVTRKEERE